MVLDSKVVEAENPLQDMDAGDNPADMGMHVVKYAAFVVVVLAGVGLGSAAYERITGLIGVNPDANLEIGGDF
jgi:hypothetical protein